VREETRSARLAADACGCKLGMAFLFAGLLWVTGRRLWGVADLWSLTNLRLLLGMGSIGKLVGLSLSRRRSRGAVRPTAQVWS